MAQNKKANKTKPLSPLAQALRETLIKSPPAQPPGYTEAEAYGHDFGPVIDALLEAGFKLEAHQGGISGTKLVAVER